jgi:hypothetical protein
MTVPACSRCNVGFSHDEIRTAAVISTISFSDADRLSVAFGGRIHLQMKRDPQLADFVNSRLGADGIFRPDPTVLEAISRIVKKTTAGLLFHEFGRVVPLSDISLIAIDHTRNIDPSALAELYRREDDVWAEATPSGRELERQVFAALGQKPRNMPKWRTYVRKFFKYMFIRRSNDTLLTAMVIHDALTVLLACPWRSRAGPRRNGRPPRQGGSRPAPKRSGSGKPPAPRGDPRRLCR